MKILAIETATEACSAALLLDGELLDRFQVAPREHGNLILSMVDELLQQAGVSLQNLDALAFGRGPGSFTGVRMATGVIQGLAFAANLPVAPVSTLKALAQQAIGQANDGQTVYAVLDARMAEVYWCEYIIENGRLKDVSKEAVIAPSTISAVPRKSVVGIGHGWDTYRDELTQVVNAKSLSIIPNALPRAREVAQLAVQLINNGQTVAAENALPVYLRDNVAKKKAQQG
ncbi:MAG: tRNA (adenosine(37)-N6)-threonylcarbamoyltransferase complex dimerization subunit type 1 TsaB [Cycloclasticus sp.]|nr:MAG: tRNA (adenosine(37)-N6)-threonylcarbamoyltransferase complex dimerization subunit type 1 TsaB [Cycloclasticus sp.]